MIKKEYRKYVLLISSIIFYLFFSIKYFFLLLALILITYYTARLLNADNKKKVLILYCILMLSVLAFYKYFNVLGNLLSINVDSIIFPLGISFYIFQLIAYFIDVYRENIDVCDDLVKFSLLITYFPKIASGPIEDSEKLLGQLDEFNGASKYKVSLVDEQYFFCFTGTEFDLYAGMKSAGFVSDNYQLRVVALNTNEVEITNPVELSYGI